MDQQQQLWHLTVIRLEGMHMLRLERSWRPIITVEIDKHDTYETILGVDGQNVNQKERFSFDQTTLSSILRVKVWQRSKSRRKAKKRNLIASGCYCLGELLTIQERELKTEIRLQRRADDKSVYSGGRAQSGAILQVRLRPPSHIKKVNQIMAESYCDDNTVKSSSSSVCSLHCPATPESDQSLISDQSIRTQPVQGYKIYSDDDFYSNTEDQYFTDSKSVIFDDDDYYTWNDDTLMNTGPHDCKTINLAIPHQQPDIKRWIAFSLLPRFTRMVVEGPPSLTRLETILASFTMYSELKEASTDSHFEQIFARLKQEWTYVGAQLLALAAVNNTTALSGAAGSLFTVDTRARSAIAASSIMCGLGIACDAWFLLRYNWADLQTFIVRARDVYDSYFFFSLSAQVPRLCMFVSALCFIYFLVVVAFDAWPQGVIASCFIVGVVMSLQFLVFGAHWFATRVLEGGREGIRRVMGTFLLPYDSD